MSEQAQAVRIRSCVIELKLCRAPCPCSGPPGGSVLDSTATPALWGSGAAAGATVFEILGRALAKPS